MSSLLLVILGYTLNMMAIDLYYYTKARHYEDHDDFEKALHNGNIRMVFASVIMILITVSEIHLGSSSIIIICIIYIYYFTMATVLCG